MESLNEGQRKGVTLTRYGHIFVSRITREGSLNILRTKTPEAVGYRAWSLMTRRVLLIIDIFFKKILVYDMLTNPVPHKSCFKDL